VPGTNGQHDLTPRQHIFVLEYLKDLNATAAARRAGYSEATAHQQGPRLLANVGVAAAIQKAMQARERRCEVKADNVLRELALVAFSRVKDYVEWGGTLGVTLKPSASLTDDQQAAVAEVSQSRSANGGTLRFKLHDKVAALEKLGKHLGLFTDRHEITGTLRMEHEVDLSRLSDDQLEQLEQILAAARGGSLEGTLSP
jgi:phage terminase small subunit